MASIRRLSASEYTIPRIQAIGQSSYRIHIPNRHYWSSRSSDPYARTLIYSKDTYYSRWIQQRDVRNARLCGSWTRRKARDHVAGKEVNKKPDSEAEKSSQKRDSQKDDMTADEFYEQLKQDTATAYNYYKHMIEKDPYRWLFDPNNTKLAWNPVEWLEKHQDIFDNRRSQANSPTTEQSLNRNSKTSSSNTVAEHSIMAEEYMIDPITLKKIPIQKQPERNTTSEESSEPSHAEASIIHDIPIKRYNNTRDKTAEDPIRNIKTSQDQAKGLTPTRKSNSRGVKSMSKLSGFASQPWLVKEGFTTAQKAPSVGATTTNFLKEPVSERIEPSLNRVNKSKADSRSSLKYPPPENTTDDVDLLRASDVRAASGHVKTKDQPLSTDTEARSKVLRSSWQDTAKTYSQDLHEAYNEVLEKRKSRINSQIPGQTAEVSEKYSDIGFKQVKQHYDELQDELDQTRKVLEQVRIQFLNDHLASETKAVKESFDGFETRPRKQTLIANVVRESTRPDVEGTSKSSKIEKSKKDAELVSQIKNIYEQSYGTITADHRQRGLTENNQQGIPNSVPKSLPVDTLTSTSSPPSGTFPVHSSDASSHQNTGSEHMTSVSLRDLLYQNISNMSIPEATQKRLKFALRGVPELDKIVHKPEQIDIVDQTNSEDTRVVATDTLNALCKSQAILLEEIRKSQATNTVGKDKPLRQGNEKDISGTSAARSEETAHIYKILALDIASGEVATATTTSSIHHKSSIPRSAAGILVHLDQPAKYFSHMEKLDADGFQLVSGSRTMLVYRRKIGQDKSRTESAVKSKMVNSNPGSLKPLREEPVFSGPLKPRERLLRSYQLAHRRARSNSKTNDALDNAKSSVSNQSNDSELNEKQSIKSKVYRGFTSKTGTVILAIFICYVVGVLQSMKAQKDVEEGARKRREEAAMKRIKDQRNEWKWF